ncbi:helix-turn-helix domain-containing protein [Paenibacillus sp. GCM10027627]|uniref:helix-turn-helix domain-containing protein n=1 Tax=unclassified Paenibacillus TaxID=185978 RepID=UPI003631E0C9
MELLGNVNTVDEVAVILKVDINTVYKWISQRKLIAMKLAGTTYRVTEKDLKYFVMQAFEEGRR